mmetsp:Transcript_5311/g.19880  ORF Transcript_5311/g.19880 Transcript_5311/m.19880 type:complete len:206 (-) Transcript_5311:1560-2177(-)
MSELSARAIRKLFGCREHTVIPPYCCLQTIEPESSSENRTIRTSSSVTCTYSWSLCRATPNVLRSCSNAISVTSSNSSPSIRRNLEEFGNEKTTNLSSNASDTSLLSREGTENRPVTPGYLVSDSNIVCDCTPLRRDEMPPEVHMKNEFVRLVGASGTMSAVGSGGSASVCTSGSSGKDAATSGDPLLKVEKSKSITDSRRDLWS